ncbi:hypothetical protein SJS41_28495 [Klebsiella quasipneumoniae]|uniref:hypothetical protein n=1 Tax=Klebsiella quasipneumoniae TaxID=1463165 RepID=UPI0029D96EBE|nr:hypothetical protein [Klebsiella quasipneumoniae]MDX7609234.1 hypothetical protein [Klebsiella quasipneumoniae]
MLNVKENKYIEIKGMVLTGSPERPVYSGGTVTAYHPEAYGVEVKENTLSGHGVTFQNLYLMLVSNEVADG